MAKTKRARSPFSEIMLSQPDFGLQNKKRNIPITLKTTTKQGKREYQKFYMRLIRNERRVVKR